MTALVHQTHAVKNPQGATPVSVETATERIAVAPALVSSVFTVYWGKLLNFS